MSVSRWERFLRWLGILPREQFLFSVYSASCWPIGEVVKTTDGREWHITSIRRDQPAADFDPEWEVWGVPA
jgi:hypothetical protein